MSRVALSCVLSVFVLVRLQTEEQALQRALEMSLADSRQVVQPALR